MRDTISTTIRYSDSIKLDEMRIMKVGKKIRIFSRAEILRAVILLMLYDKNVYEKVKNFLVEQNGNIS